MNLNCVLFIVLISKIACIAAVERGELSEYVEVPGGNFVHRSCFHQIEAGAVLFESNNASLEVHSPTGTRRALQRCPHPAFNNYLKKQQPAWKTWVQYSNDAKVSSISAKWEVPPNPSVSSGQILYYWIGLAPADYTMILHPVLQWGVSPGISLTLLPTAGGGSYWGLASWFISNDYGAIVTTVVPVSPRTIVYGETTGKKNGTWVVTASDTSSAQSTYFTFKSAGITFDSAFAALEGYFVSKCTHYPPTGQLTFNHVAVKVGNKLVIPFWQAYYKNNFCHERTRVMDPTELQILFDAM